MMADVAVILPTRGRPDKTRDCVAAWRENSVRSDLIVCLDDDDPTLDAYDIEPDVTYRVGPRVRMCPTVNSAAQELWDDYDYLAFIGDDHLIRTHGWDHTLVETIGEWGIGYGNDLLQGERLATHCVMSANIPRTVGYMALPGTIHLYMDNFWMTLGTSCGFLHYRPDVTVEHMHFVNGKAERDDRYAEVNSPAMYEHDRVIYERWRDGGQARVDVDKVLAAMR